MRVLIVEDMEDIVLLERTQLERRHIDVSSLHPRDVPGECADVLVCDLHYPGVDIPAFLRTVRTQGEVPRIVLCTADSRGGRVVYDEGLCDALVLKPYDERDLLRGVGCST